MVSNSELLIYLLYAFASLPLPTITYSHPLIDMSQLELYVNPIALVAGVKA